MENGKRRRHVGGFYIFLISSVCSRMPHPLLMQEDGSKPGRATGAGRTTAFPLLETLKVSNCQIDLDVLVSRTHSWSSLCSCCDPVRARHAQPAPSSSAKHPRHPSVASLSPLSLHPG